MTTPGLLKLAWQAAACPELWQLGPRQLIGLIKASRGTRPAAAPSGTIFHINCPPAGTLAFRRYLKGLRVLADGGTVPLAAHVSVTDRCGYACRRCSNLRLSAGDPSAAKLLRLLTELKLAGTASLAFTGGEPLLRPDLEQLVAACLPEMAPLLFTSGQGLDAERAQRLRQAGLTAACVSLDHYEAQEHEAIRGVAGAFETALRAISFFLEAGIYTAAQAVVTPALLEDGALERFLAFCRRLGVHDVILLEPVEVCGQGGPEWFDAAARARLVEVHLRAIRDLSLPKVTAMSFLEGPQHLGCQAGTTFLYVSAAGEVFPCDFAPVGFGNVFELGLPEVLRRLAETFPSPASDCLALKLRPRPDGTPLPWGELKAELPRSAAPALMKWFLPSGGEKSV